MRYMHISHMTFELEMSRLYICALSDERIYVDIIIITRVSSTVYLGIAHGSVLQHYI